jgi:multimeric flavodoxin WrbA
MTKISIVYHSGYGHTSKVAEAINEGAKNAGADVSLLKADALNEGDWSTLDGSDAIVFGAPTYMRGVSGPFKMFIDETSKRWGSQKWQNKVAAGFTNSSNYSVDKLASIQQLFHLAMQHGMIWVGQTESAPTYKDKEIPSHETINRIGSWSGLMTQANHQSGPESAPPAGDIETARRFGARIVGITKKIRQ